MILLRSPKGWGVPARGRPRASRWRAPSAPTRCRCRRSPTTRRSSSCWSTGCVPTAPRSCSPRTAGPTTTCSPTCPRERAAARPRAAGQRRAAAARPAAAAGRAGSRSRCRDRVTPDASPTGTAGGWLADLMRATEDRRDFRVVCPDELESNKLDAVLSVTDRAYAWPVPEHRRTRRARRPGHGGAVRAPVPGLAAGLPADRPARPVSRATRPSRPSWTAWSTSTPSSSRCPREVPWRAPVAEPELPADQRGLAPGAQRLQPPGPRVHQQPAEQEGLGQPRSTCHRTPTPCWSRCAAAWPRPGGSTWSSPARTRPRSGWTSTPPSDTAVPAPASGSGRAPTTDDPDVVLACAGGIPTVEVLAAAWLLRQRPPSCGCAWSTWSTCSRSRTRDRHPHGMSEEEFTALLRRRRAGRVRLPRLPVGGPRGAARPHRTRPASTSTATSRRAPRPRRSTCWSATR